MGRLRFLQHAQEFLTPGAHLQSAISTIKTEQAARQLLKSCGQDAPELAGKIPARIL
jgi:hypothetical protein